MKRHLFTLAFVGALGALSAGAAAVFAADVTYPVRELGNCASQAGCKTYCDSPSHAEACLDFAEANSLMSIAEIQTARKFLKSGSGPGGCTGKDSCEAYCDSVEHIDECVAFAEENDLMPPKELAEAKKIQAARARGVKMPACGSKKQCDSYCSQADHMEECITFAQEAGFLPEDELEEAKKVLSAIKAGAKPPPCSGREACDAYCSEEEHFDSCLDFALAAGFMDPKDAEMAKKTRGKGPGGCRGREQCEAFCQQDGNMAACAEFAYENGMMTKEEFEMMKKTGGKGPGGCRGKDECENFCKNPANQETCIQFARENGMMSEEDVRRMEEGKQQFRTAMQSMPPEVYSCLESLIGADTMAKFKSGEAMPPQEIGDVMRECFEKNMQSNMPPAGGGQGMPQGAGGPGGCRSPEECQAYCQSNPEACAGFGPPGGSPRGTPPGGVPPCEGEGCGQPPAGDAGSQYQQYHEQQQFGPGPEAYGTPPEGMRDTLPPEGMMPPGGESFGPPEGQSFGPPSGESGPPPEASAPPQSTEPSEPAPSEPTAPPAGE
ncbi:MAG: hypothetical protein HYS45_02955 [Parcubacteria group bacterium]|nr:hypothetical protein [Parcubacteria group bacterium]